MRLWRDIATTLTVMVSLSAAAVSAQTRVIPMTIADAVRACITATVPTGIDEQQLVAAGWEGTDLALDAKDKAPLRVYTHGRGPLLVTGSRAGAKKSGCNVLSALSDGVDYETVVTLVGGELGQSATSRDRNSNEVLWIVGPTGVMLAPTGQPDRPAIRATIIDVSREKK